MADPETTRRLRDMQRQIDDLSVTLAMLMGGFAVVLFIAVCTASEVFWK